MSNSIEVIGLSKKYKSKDAVKDLNFRERISIEPVKGARVSNKILDISGAKLDI